MVSAFYREGQPYTDQAGVPTQHQTSEELSWDITDFVNEFALSLETLSLISTFFDEHLIPM